jgi:RimJ/RimL family protein N-acetyltransferase
MRRIVAITSPDNDRSTRLLDALGLRFERAIRLPGEDRDVNLFATP